MRTSRLQYLALGLYIPSRPPSGPGQFCIFCRCVVAELTVKSFLQMSWTWVPDEQSMLILQIVQESRAACISTCNLYFETKFQLPWQPGNIGNPQNVGNSLLTHTTRIFQTTHSDRIEFAILNYWLSSPPMRPPRGRSRVPTRTGLHARRSSSHLKKDKSALDSYL